MRILIALLSLILVAVTPLTARAGETETTPKVNCKHLVGTYLTKNKPADEAADKFTSRSLISLAGAHLILFTDSGEGGEAGFAPFTDGRGSWHCFPDDEDTIKVRATTLDFTAPAAGSEGGIGRLDFDLVVAPEAGTLSGTATLYLVPLADDPLAEDRLKNGREFAIAGQRLKVR
jgi:hypothetical protein